MNDEVKKRIISVIDLLSQPNAYTTRTYARTASKDPVGSCSSNATCWCVAGAIDKVVNHDENLFNETWVEVTRRFKNNKEAIAFFDSIDQTRAIRFLSNLVGLSEPTRQAGQNQQHRAARAIAFELLK